MRLVRAETEMWRLSGKVALVTGASSGLGARFAEVLCDAGAQVIATARRRDRLDALSSATAGRIISIAGDLTSAEHRAALAERLDAEFQRLDILVNNAGVCDDGPVEAQALDDISWVIDVNLTSTIDLCRLCAPLLFAAGSSSVINIASIYGLVASRSPMVAYNATKGAIVNLTRHLAAQWGDRGVRVNGLAPGYFPTELTGDLTDPDFAREIAERTLLGRVPDISELDGPLLFLASTMSSYVTGHTLAVDAGWTAV
jgi:NAD(P)-dependent dehydrogenase (short-subunit alcohol dehydrogenase family)